MSKRSLVFCEFFLTIVSIFLLLAYVNVKETPYLIIFIVVFTAAVLLGLKIKLSGFED